MTIFLLTVVLCSVAKAVPVNPAVWNFSLETLATDEGGAFWGSPTEVYTDYPQYDYSWKLTPLTGAELQVAGGWYGAMDYIPDGDKSGSGTVYGLPTEISSKHYGEPGVFGVNISSWIDENGSGWISATELYFGYVEGHKVTGFRCNGEVIVTAVPEPATAAWLVLGGLALLRKRRA
jgi:hypothetical protein